MKENIIVKRDIDFFVEHVPFLDQLRDQSVLVTGATGLIGSTFIKCLIGVNERYSANIRIVAMARSQEKAEAIFGDAAISWI